MRGLPPTTMSWPADAAEPRPPVRGGRHAAGRGGVAPRGPGGGEARLLTTRRLWVWRACRRQTSATIGTMLHRRGSDMRDRIRRIRPRVWLTALAVVTVLVFLEIPRPAPGHPGRTSRRHRLRHGDRRSRLPGGTQPGRVRLCPAPRRGGHDRGHPRGRRRDHPLDHDRRRTLRGHLSRIRHHHDHRAAGPRPSGHACARDGHSRLRGQPTRRSRIRHRHPLTWPPTTSCGQVRQPDKGPWDSESIYNRRLSESANVLITSARSATKRRAARRAEGRSTVIGGSHGVPSRARPRGWAGSPTRGSRRVARDASRARTAASGPRARENDLLGHRLPAAGRANR